jgi:hypothetical protein
MKSNHFKNTEKALTTLSDSILKHIREQDVNNKYIENTRITISEVNNVGYKVDEGGLRIGRMSNSLHLNMYSEADIPSACNLDGYVMNRLEKFIYNKIKDSIPTSHEIIKHLESSITELEKSNDYLEEEKEKLYSVNLRNAINKVILKES